jgi:prepilin-type N-terminal cleavage/methylation domain-containing protein
VKNSGGFSYIEVLIALAIFAVALAAVLPVLQQAGHNLAYAQSGYTAHLRAQQIMLATRDALTADETPQFSSYNFPFTVWLTNEAGGSILFSTPNAPLAGVEITGLASLGNRTVIVVIVWCEDGFMAARAMGII